MPLSPEIRALGAILAIALATAGCDSNGAGSDEGDRTKQVSVEVHRVEPRLLRDVEIFGGQLAAEHSVMLKPERSGVITEILFEEGQRVKQGDVLFRLRDDEEKARLAEAEAQLALAREVDKRTRSLVTRNAASEAQRDEAVAELAVAKARVELARVELARTEIRAPFDGVVGMRLVSLGDRVSAGGMRGGSESSLVQIDAIDRLELTMAVSEHGVLYGRVGAPVELSVLPYPGEKFAGEIFFVSPTLEPSTRRVYMKAWVPNDQALPISREKSRLASTILASIITCGVCVSIALMSAVDSSITDGMSLRIRVLVRVSTFTEPRGDSSRRTRPSRSFTSA